MPTLVLLRHGQSQWNLENRFTGWWDVDLSEAGLGEARAAGRLLKGQGLRLRLLLHQRAHASDPDASPRPSRDGPAVAPGRQGLALNERHYGGLTGLNKQEMIDKVGEEQVKIWRRSYDIPPPPLPDGQPV